MATSRDFKIVTVRVDAPSRKLNITWEMGETIVMHNLYRPRYDEMPGYQRDEFDTVVEFIVRYWKVPHRFVWGLVIGEFMNLQKFKESLLK